MQTAPITQLSDYERLIHSVSAGSPLFLTKDGVSRFVLVDIDEYRKKEAELQLFSKLAEAEAAVKSEDDWLTAEEVDRRLGLV